MVQQKMTLIHAMAGLATAPLLAGNNFPAALCPRFFQLRELQRIEGRAGRIRVTFVPYKLPEKRFL